MISLVSESTYEDLSNKASLGDLMEAFLFIPDKSIDLIILDPPYNVSKLRNGNDGKKFLDVAIQKNWERMVQEWDKIDNYLDWSYLWMEQCRRVLKDNGTMFIFGTIIHNLPEIVLNARKLNMYIMNHITWIKDNAAPLLAGCKLKPSHEEILWIRKGKSNKYKFNYEVAKTINAAISKDGKLKQMSDAWIINTAASESVKYPCQKPLELFRRMILIASNEGDTILDMFCGSGGTAVVARDNKRNFIAVDSCPEAVIKTNMRLAGINLNKIKKDWTEYLT